MQGELIIAPEFRDIMITSPHALRIALRVNSNLKLVRDFESKNGDIYQWALVDTTQNLSLPVHSTIANSAISAGYVRL